MIYVALTFHPNQKNPARADGHGVYRVFDCRRFSREPLMWVNNYIRVLWLRTTREYKIGSRVDPLKIALAARRAA
jgi:hypothetical protein